MKFMLNLKAKVSVLRSFKLGHLKERCWVIAKEKSSKIDTMQPYFKYLSKMLGQPKYTLLAIFEVHIYNGVPNHVLFVYLIIVFTFQFDV